MEWRVELWMWSRESYFHGPLARYVKLRIAHAPGMPGSFSPPPRVSDPGMHHGMCVTHMPWCMLGSLTSGSLWSWWYGNCSRHSRRMRSPQFTYLVRGSFLLFQFQLSGNEEITLVQYIHCPIFYANWLPKKLDRVIIVRARKTWCVNV